MTAPVNPTVSHSWASERLKYDPESGYITRRVRSNNQAAGKRIGYVRPDGYRETKLSNKSCLEHRLCWFLHTGKWPFEIDHINGDRSDNRIQNLREVTKLENAKNKAATSRNSSGFLGVSWVHREQRWIATIRVDGRCVYLGRFLTVNDAALARKQAEKSHGFHQNHGRSS